MARKRRKRKNPDENIRRLSRRGDDPARELLEKERAGLIPSGVIKAAAMVGNQEAKILYPEVPQHPLRGNLGLHDPMPGPSEFGPNSLATSVYFDLITQTPESMKKVLIIFWNEIIKRIGSDLSGYPTIFKKTAKYLYLYFKNSVVETPPDWLLRQCGIYITNSLSLFNTFNYNHDYLILRDFVSAIVGKGASNYFVFSSLYNSLTRSQIQKDGVEPASVYHVCQWLANEMLKPQMPLSLTFKRFDYLRRNPDEKLRQLQRRGDDPVRLLLEQERAGIVNSDVIKAAAIAGHPIASQIYSGFRTSGLNAIEKIYGYLASSPANLKLAFKCTWILLGKWVPLHDMNIWTSQLHNILKGWFYHNPEVSFKKYLQSNDVFLNEELYEQERGIRAEATLMGQSMYSRAIAILHFLYAVRDMAEESAIDHILTNLTYCFTSLYDGVYVSNGHQMLLDFANCLLPEDTRDNPGDITAALQSSYHKSYPVRASIKNEQAESKKEKLLVGLWEAYHATDDAQAKRIILNKINKLALQS